MATMKTGTPAYARMAARLLQQRCATRQFNQNRRIEFRIIFLHVPCPIFLLKFLYQSFHAFGVVNGNSSTLCLDTSGVYSNRRILEDVLVPLSAGALYRQEV